MQVIFRQVFLFIVFLNLIIWPSECDWQHVHILCRYPELSVMKKAFLLMSSAKDVMARSPRVTCPLIAIRKSFKALISSLRVCVPVCGGQQWPYAVVCWMEMSRCVRRRLEAGGREKVEKICLITSWYFEELLPELFNTRDFRDLIWILWSCICVQFPKLANDKNVLASKYLHSAEVKPGMLSESCAFLRELCFFV